MPQLKGVDKGVFETLRNIYRNFSEADAQRIKDIESVTNHDVKAVEYFLKEEFDKLGGMEDLLCKQIIRDHDEFAGRRGCRINAEPAEKGGFAVYFTLPRYLKRIQPGR